MIRLTPQRRPRISNRVALVAALALALVTYAGYLTTRGSAQLPGATGNVAAIQSEERANGDPPERKRKLSVSLLLFGRG